MSPSRRRSTRLKEKEQDTVLGVHDIAAELSLEFNIPITISQDPNDQLTLKDVFGIYAREGVEKWDTKTRLAFAKALSLIRTTPSSQSIPSNHGIWRAAVHRGEGWNWAYWIIFRAIYGKDSIKGKARVVNAVKKSFPGTDIWSASTPAHVADPNKPTSPNSEQIFPSITVASTLSDDAPVTTSTTTGFPTNKRKHPDDAVVDNAPRSKQPATQPHNPSVPGESARQNSPNVADVTRMADPTQDPSEESVIHSETPGDAQGPTVAATESLPAIKPTGQLAALEHTHLYRQVRDELSAQFTDEIRKMKERLSLQARANDYVGQLFEDIRDIKRRLDALEDISRARDRIAAMYSMPPPTGISGHSLHVAVEALGLQVDYCTRNIHELKTGQPYEDDPALLCIKRERVRETNPDI